VENAIADFKRKRTEIKRILKEACRLIHENQFAGFFLS
jgi:RNase P protein component